MEAQLREVPSAPQIRLNVELAPTPQRRVGAELLGLYRQMARVRALSAEATRMQRQGMLPVFVPSTGQEAAQVGSAAALDTRHDFAFPTYREFGAMLALGVSPLALLAHHRGYADGGLFDAREAHVAPIYASVGGTVLHAVGWALGAALDGDAACALAYFGDGASSKGDVHEALNFAAVSGAPVVFFCQNNGWAISVPTSAQVGGGSVAARAAGYGIRGVTVDGNDVEAVRDVTAAAVDRARAGQGPTLIEALTYRLGPHTTSDDPGRYRSADEVEARQADDPLRQARAKLVGLGVTADALTRIDRELDAEVALVRAELDSLSPPRFADVARLAYRAVPPLVAAQTSAWLQELEDV